MTQNPVGASLLAIAQSQLANECLKHRYREQARSYRVGVGRTDIKLFDSYRR